MPYHVSWLVQDRVLYDRKWDDITPEEIRALNRQIADTLHQAYQKKLGIVIAILDMRDANLSHLMQSHSPAGIRRITDAIDPRIWKVKQGFTILITARKHVKVVISLITKVSAQPMTTVESFDE